MSFLCSLAHFLLKNVIVFIFEKQLSKWRSFEKGLFLTYFSHFLVTREIQKFHRIYLMHLHKKNTYLAHRLAFLPTNIAKYYEFIMWFLFVRFLVLILICTMLEQSIQKNGENNLSWNVYY